MRFHGKLAIRIGSPYSGQTRIFLCQGPQGGRGKGSARSTFGPNGDETSDRGAWLSLWVEDVNAVYRECLAQRLDVTWPPTEMPWNVREMHLRHPDGHVFRIGRGIEDSEA